MNDLRYLALDGPIGAGKTTLAHRLAGTLAAESLLEQPEQNPFLERFYQDRRANALPAQLCFLLQRARQLEQLRQGDLFQRQWVADFLFEKDRIFAQLNLDGHEMDLYEQIWQRLAWEAPQPDCVIYLHAPIEVLMQRVRQRARPEEHSLSSYYLNQVATAYAAFFSRYRGSRLVTVDSARMDLVNAPRDYERLIEALSSADPVVQLG
ncbi:MAG: deoxynucleoside kinase [Nevskiales bacterium]